MSVINKSWTYNGRFVTADGENPIYTPGTLQEEIDGIARLIAATPDLLRAAKNAQQTLALLLEVSHKQGYCGCTHCAAEKYLHEAIAKAEGQ